MAGLQKRIGPLTPRRSRMIGSIIAVLLAAPISAQANNICDSLRAELRQLSTVIGNTAQVRQFASALTQQNIIVRRIKNDLRRYGCSSGSIVVYGNPNAQLCGEIGDALAQAEAERDMIAEDRDRMLAMQRNNQSDDHRERIMAALDAEGCFDEGSPDYASADPYRNPETRGYTDPFNDPRPEERGDYSPMPDMPMQGGLRTLCVRTCDGAFFPISSNATPLDFRAQAAQCARMCPGTETELFYHAMEGQESSDMVSAKTGKPYTSMPTAFAYRNGSATNRSSSCSCNMAAYHDEMKMQEQQASAPQSTPHSGITQIPSPQGDKASKPPETKTEAEAEPVPDREYDPKSSHVRVVGPQFLPEETSRIDLKNPALKGTQPQQDQAQ